MKSMVQVITHEPVPTIVSNLTKIPTLFTVYVCSLYIAYESHKFIVILHISSKLVILDDLPFICLYRKCQWIFTCFICVENRMFFICIGIRCIHFVPSSQQFFHRDFISRLHGNMQYCVLKNIPMSYNFDWNSTDMCLWWSNLMIHQRCCRSGSWCVPSVWTYDAHPRSGHGNFHYVLFMWVSLWPSTHNGYY